MPTTPGTHASESFLIVDSLLFGTRDGESGHHHSHSQWVCGTTWSGKIVTCHADNPPKSKGPNTYSSGLLLCMCVYTWHNGSAKSFSWGEGLRDQESSKFWHTHLDFCTISRPKHLHSSVVCWASGQFQPMQRCCGIHLNPSNSAELRCLYTDCIRLLHDMIWSITKGAISSPLVLWGLDSGTWTWIETYVFCFSWKW